MNNFFRNKILLILACIFSLHIYAVPSEGGSISINGTSCLEVSSANIGGKLKASDCNNAENQKFIIDGSFIRLKADQQKCLSYMKNAELGSNLFVWSCEQDNSAVSPEHSFFIDINNIKLSSTDGACIKSSEDSAEIVVVKCDDTNVNKIAFQTEILVNNQCLQIDNDKNGSIARAETCDNSINQQFFMYGNLIKPVLNINKCLDSFDSDIDFKNPAKITLMKLYVNDCALDNVHQKFSIINDKYTSLGLKSLCLSVFKGKKFDVTNPAVLVQCTSIKA